MATLNANVLVRNENGDKVVLLAGNEVPEWAVDQLGEHLTALTLPSERGENPDEDPASAGYPGSNGTENELVPGDEEEVDEEEEDEELAYSEWTKEQLKAEAKERELTGYGSASKEDLVKLLEADDAIQAETEED